MTYTDPPTLHVRTTTDLLALIPFLLGYHPESSLVLIVRDGDGRLILAGHTTLPTAHADLGWLSTSMSRLAARLTGHLDVSAVLAGYGPARRVERAVHAAAGALDQTGIPISEALRVADGRFWHLGSEQTGPPDGTVFDPAGSTVTAEAVYAGLVALPDRAAFTATLDPVTGPARTGMIAATAAACQFLADLMDAAAPAAGHEPDAALDTPVGQALQHAARTYLGLVQDRYRSGQPADDEHAATLTVLLALPTLRDFAARHTTAEPWQLTMWHDLVRRAEPEFATVPATLLALAALQAGNGTLADIAIRRALDTDPDDPFARLLAQALAAGIAPDTAATLVADENPATTGDAR